jgi:hypothetical protein
METGQNLITYIGNDFQKCAGSWREMDFFKQGSHINVFSPVTFLTATILRCLPFIYLLKEKYGEKVPIFYKINRWDPRKHRQIDTNVCNGVIKNIIHFVPNRLIHSTVLEAVLHTVSLGSSPRDQYEVRRVCMVT